MLVVFVLHSKGLCVNTYEGKDHVPQLSLEVSYYVFGLSLVLV